MIIVVKIGSNILTTADNKLDLNNLRNLCNQIEELRKTGIKVVIVTSGAIVCGSERLQIKAVTIPEKQAAAAVGQSLLVNEYNNFFESHGVPVAQILLTKDSITDDIRRQNARNTLDTILRLGAIPIINENDTVSVEEIKFGDNDMLSASVAVLIEADQLIILSDIDGLHTANPRLHNDTKLIPIVEHIDASIDSLASEVGSGKGVGGMVSKINSAKYATMNNIETRLANGRENRVLIRLCLENERLGTVFYKSI